MSINEDLQKRKYPRFETEVKVHFQLPYDFRTEIDFSVDVEAKHGSPQMYVGFSKNISVQGLCFESNKRLNPGDVLWLELHMPSTNEIIYMQGQVRWCQLSSASPETVKSFVTGLEVHKVDGVDIEQTVYFDEQYGVTWSHLLERVLGNFAKAQKKSKPSGE
jgi:hypothetical protein